MRGIFILIMSVWLDILLSWLDFTPIGLNVFMPLLSIVGIIYLYKYLEDNIGLYLIIAFCTGLFYDLAILNTGILNALIYLLLAFITAIIASYFKPHYIANLMITMINITIYLCLSYTILLLYKVYLFNIWTLLFGLLGSYLINIIYLSIITYIDKKYTKKRQYIRL